ncbi:MAG: universal stress protein [Pseudomonadota bacterium]
MNRFKKILFALTDTEDDLRAVANLVDLARATNASVHVVSTEHGRSDVLQSALTMLGWKRSFVDDVHAAAHAHLARIRDEFAAHKLSVTSASVEGPAFIAAIQEGLAMGADLIAVPAAGDGAPTPFVQHLMRKAPCPVWMMRSWPSTLQRGFNRILCAVDPQTADAERMKLAHSTLRLARSLAVHHNAALTVLHSWHVDEVASLRSSGFLSVSEEELQSIELAAETGAQARLDALIAEHALEDLGAEIMLEHGKPATAIKDAADITSADLVVLGTVGRTGIPGLLIGNTAEEVLGSVHCSVIAVKPEGFESPVAPNTPTGSAVASPALASI